MEGGSKSGTGSSLEATVNIRESLQGFLKKYDVRSMLDIPCGDFYWMSKMDLAGIKYIGADIVPEIVHDNRKHYSQPCVCFEVLNLISDQLPACDLIFSRDCLVHLTNEQIEAVIENVRRSGAKYFAMTTYEDGDNSMSGHVDRWRPLDLTKPPFNLPHPMEALDDSWPRNPVDQYKRIGVWRVTDL